MLKYGAARYLGSIDILYSETEKGDVCLKRMEMFYHKTAAIDYDVISEVLLYSSTDCYTKKSAYLESDKFQRFYNIFHCCFVVIDRSVMFYSLKAS